MSKRRVQTNALKQIKTGCIAVKQRKYFDVSVTNDDDDQL